MSLLVMVGQVPSAAAAIADPAPTHELKSIEIAGAAAGRATDIDGSTVVGTLIDELTGQERGFVYDLVTGQTSDAAGPGIFTESDGYAATGVDGPWVVGTWSSADASHAYAYNRVDGETRDLFEVGESWSAAIDGTVVVGTRKVGDGAQRAFAHDLASGVTTDLGTLFLDPAWPEWSDWSQAVDIDGHVVVVNAKWDLGAESNFFVYDLRDGTKTQVGPPPWSLLSAGAVAISGNTIVGWSDEDSEDLRSFVYDFSEGSWTKVEPRERGFSDVDGHTAVGFDQVWWKKETAPLRYDLDTGTANFLALCEGCSNGEAVAVDGDLIVGSVTAGETVSPAVWVPVDDPDLAPVFVDVPGTQPFVTEITWLAQEGISKGWVLPDGSVEYRPLDQITRDAMAAFMYRLAGSPAFPAPVVSPFVDVPTTQPFYKEITWLASEGISTGWPVAGGKEYRPTAQITRDAMAAFMFRYQESQVGTIVFTVPPVPPFTDVPTSQPFYREITWLAQEGISTGWDVPAGKEYRPVNQITRDAMAAFMYRLAHLE